MNKATDDAVNDATDDAINDLNDLNFFHYDQQSVPVKLETSSKYYSFENIVNHDANHMIRDIYVQSNSPLSLSGNNSPMTLSGNNSDSDDNDNDNDNGYESTSEDFAIQILDAADDTFSPSSSQKKKKSTGGGKWNVAALPPPSSSAHVSSAKSVAHYNMMDKYYEYNDNYSSNLDILITYTRCQKSILLKSGYVTEVRYFLLVIPTIVIGIIISIFAPEMEKYNFSGNIISALNVIMTALISIANYLKLESKAEMFKQLHKQYDKLELSLEMTNNKLLYIDSHQQKNQLILHKLNDMEIKINEMIEINNVTIPSIVKNSFPIVCNVNVFSLLKKLESYKKSLYSKFYNIKREIRDILQKWKKGNLNDRDNIDNERQKQRLLFLYKMKEQLKSELIQFNEVYNYIDEYFSKEIAYVDTMSHFYILFCGWFSRTKTLHQFEADNLNDEKKIIVDKYFRIILDEI